MKGIILIPKVYHNTISHLIYEPLFEMIRREFGFEQIAVDKVPLRKLKKYDVVLSFKSPQKSDPDNLKELVDLDKSTKLITYFSDVHPHMISNKVQENAHYMERMRLMMERADVVMSAYNETFRKIWPQFVDKMVWFPQFVGIPEFAKSVPHDLPRINRTFVSGALGYYYPLRSFAVNDEQCRKYSAVLKHPGYGKIELNGHKIGQQYYYEISKYSGALATTSILNCVLMKHFEIPSVGTILISDRCADMDALGFVESVNYLNVSRINIAEVMRAITEYSDSFKGIRRNGRNHVLQNHTVYNRFQKFKEILEAL